MFRDSVRRSGDVRSALARGRSAAGKCLSPKERGHVESRSMLGLRVTVRGRQPVVMALSDELPIVRAGVGFRTGLRSKSGIGATGLDDRDDHVHWLWSRAVPTGAWIEIEVVDVREGDVPVRPARTKVDWRLRFREMRERDERRLAQLERRLKRLPHVVLWKESRPPRGGLELSLNGRMLSRLAVGHPGAVSVDVAGIRPPGRRPKFELKIFGTERLAPRVWRRSKWPWNGRRLRIGDTVRITVVPAARAQVAKVRELEVYEPRTKDEILADIARLRKHMRPSWYEKEAAMMLAHDRRRPPPRRYASFRKRAPR